MQPPVTFSTTITPCLWFDDQAEEAAQFYTSIFPSSKITAISRYGEAGREVHGKPPGSVLTVAFELAGQAFTALNGGPVFRFNEAVSLQVGCDTQAEIDWFWARLCEDGAEGQCGWLKDRYGLSWQIVPRALPELLTHADREKSARAMQAMLQMKKLDIAALRRAAAGTGELPEVEGGVAPYLTVDGASRASDFYQRAFGAEEVHRHPLDEQGRTMHVHLYVNGGSLMLSDAYPEHGHPLRAPQAFNLHLQVEGVDRWWRRAVEAGCEIVSPLQVMFWGDRYGQLRDPFGVLWSVASHVEPV